MASYLYVGEAKGMIKNMNTLQKWLLNNTNPGNKKSLAYHFRMQRMRFFEEFYEECILGDSEIGRIVKILDVGGTLRFWQTLDFRYLDMAEITLLNLREEKLPDNVHNISSVVGDATDLSRYSDKQFDLVFSNSVIEHVGNYNAQKRMACELARVGRYVFLQTPNKFFFMEPHFLFPFFQWLPLSLRAWLIEKGYTTVGKVYSKNRKSARTCAESIRLLTRRELETFFPDANIKREKFCLMTKSFYLYF